MSNINDLVTQIKNNTQKVYDSGKLSVLRNSEHMKGTASGKVVTMNDVSPVEHSVDVRVESKNLIPYPYVRSTHSTNGMTFIDNGDGTITLDGTASYRTVFYLHGWDKDAVKIEEGETYTISGAVSDICWIQCSNEVGYPTDEGLGKTFVADSGGYYFYLVVPEGVVANNILIKPQVERGSVATEYTPYVNFNASPENLLPLIEDQTTPTGVTITKTNDGYVINGTPNNPHSFPVSTVTLEKGMYYFSLGNQLTDYYVFVSLIDEENFTHDPINLSSRSGVDYYQLFEVTERVTFTYSIGISDGYTYDDTVISPQLISGSEPIIVSQYGKNLFDYSGWIDSHITVLDKSTGEFIFNKSVSSIKNKARKLPAFLPNTSYRISGYVKDTIGDHMIHISPNYTDGSNDNISVTTTAEELGEWKRFEGYTNANRTLSFVAFGGSGGLKINTSFKEIQIESIHTASSDYESFFEETYALVNGGSKAKSISPSMTLTSCQDDVVLDCSYLRDIDTYIDNLIQNVAMTGGE